MKIIKCLQKYEINVKLFAISDEKCGNINEFCLKFRKIKNPIRHYHRMGRVWIPSVRQPEGCLRGQSLTAGE
ncbi:hypothetical protein, partial [Duncaniella muris]|uniref:hypothetical protein n=1 Tax=Duncaniella muris TaxID=2094150 RepID=UPI003F5D28CC